MTNEVTAKDIADWRRATAPNQYPAEADPIIARMIKASREMDAAIIELQKLNTRFTR